MWKKDLNALSESFGKKLLQSVTKRESFTKFKIVIAKCYKNYYKMLKLLKSVTRGYYKV